MREVARSKPTFSRRLFYASLFFTVLFLADIVLIARLAFDDLGHQVVDEAFRASLAALETRLPVSSPVPDDPYPSTEPCPSDVSSSGRTGPCVATPRPPVAAPRVFRGMSYRWQRVVTDTQGRVLWRGFGQGHRIDRPDAPGGSRLSHADVPERWQIGGEPQDVVALHQAGPSSEEFHEVGIPRELLDQELARLRRDLSMKLWAGATAAVLLLLLAFLYVMRLLHRTRALEAQAQMDDRLAYVGALAAGLAHEIRNPLNVLSMNLQMLEEELGRPGDGDPRLFLNALQGEIRRLSNLVNNFLTYARPNQPRFEARDLNEVLRDVCNFVRPEFETRSVRLDTSLAPYLPPVDLDEAQIRQAVLNILMNAAQVLKPGGRVQVESRVGPQGEAIIVIEDDGPGIQPEDQQKIFEVFYSTRGGGTGLGLPIAARIMESHGGSIAVERPEGGGARFVLTLPRRHPGGAASGAAGAVAAYGVR